jgi:pyrroline-5-carboxylate reductase
MATESPLSLSTLMQNVMSPQGSTEQAIFSLQGDHFSQIIERAMNACMERAQTMQNEFGV